VTGVPGCGFPHLLNQSARSYNAVIYTAIFIALDNDVAAYEKELSQDRVCLQLHLIDTFALVFAGAFACDNYNSCDRRLYVVAFAVARLQMTIVLGSAPKSVTPLAAYRVDGRQRHMVQV
jgi:hypothetical protein